jgi:hypothetical protein
MLDAFADAFLSDEGLRSLSVNVDGSMRTRFMAR